MRLTKERRAELKALADKLAAGEDAFLFDPVANAAHCRWACVAYQNRQALPDALEDLEELEGELTRKRDFIAQLHEEIEQLRDPLRVGNHPLYEERNAFLEEHHEEHHRQERALESKLADAVKALEEAKADILVESASDIVRHIDAALAKLKS